MEIIHEDERAEDHEPNTKVKQDPDRTLSGVQERVGPFSAHMVDDMGFSEVEQTDGIDDQDMRGYNGHGVDRDFDHDHDQISAVERVIAPESIRCNLNGHEPGVSLVGKIPPVEERDNDTKRVESEERRLVMQSWGYFACKSITRRRKWVLDLLEGTDGLIEEKVHIRQQPMLPLKRGSSRCILLPLCFSLGESILSLSTAGCLLITPFAECVP